MIEITTDNTADKTITNDQFYYIQVQQIIIWVFCALIFAYFVFIIVLLPIMKKRKDDQNYQKRQELYKKLHRGHEVLLASGIFGTVVDKQGEIYFIEVAQNVVIKVNRSYVLGFFDQSLAEQMAKTKKKKKQ